MEAQAEQTEGRRTRILVVDDDSSVREALFDFLANHGYDVASAGDSREMDRELARVLPDLIVLDYMMPGENGLEVCRRIRKGGPPIIMLSAKGYDDVERIVGLEAGADDYLGKPFHPRELLARIRSVLRRGEPAAAQPVRIGYAFGNWALSLQERSLIDPSGASILLSRGEFGMLKVFVENPQRVLSRDLLVQLMHGPNVETYDRATDLQVSRLRRKLDDSEGVMIQTVRGEGYLFAAKVRRL
ncbi:MAG: response regulator [Alphaproteobacteria bacterium]|nr:response regulator [Alphaproteobacteria bacterium]